MEKNDYTFPLLVCMSKGFATLDSLLLPLLSSEGATDFLLPAEHGESCFTPHGRNKPDTTTTHLWQNVACTLTYFNHKTCCRCTKIIILTFHCRWWRHLLRFVIFLHCLTHKRQCRFRLILSVRLSRTRLIGKENTHTHTN